MNTFIVIPAYNESERIGNVINTVKKLGYNNIVLVDDGSKDQKKTEQIARKYDVNFLAHVINLGKGAALKTGCDFAFEKDAEEFLVMDADGQHDPAEIPSFLEMLKGKDIVFGSRKYNKKMPLIMLFGNNFINTVASILFKVKVKDVLSGYRAFTREAYKKIRWDSLGYTVEVEMIANSSRKKLKYAEKEIKTIYPDKYKGTTVFDGIGIVLYMIWIKLTR